MPDDRPPEIIEQELGIIIPPREKPSDDAGYFAMLTKSVFLAGFSWKVIHRKWDNFLRAFEDFDVDTVAGYGLPDIERLVTDASIVRNGKKIEATIGNARVMQDIIAEHGSFHDYLRSMDGMPYTQRRDALSKRFKWLGRTGSFVFLYVVDEDVPEWHQR